jgi:hypothetical protein
VTATVLFKTIDGARGEDIGVFLGLVNARLFASRDAKRLYVGFAKTLNWTRSVDYKRAWEAMVGVTGVRYVAQTWDMED